MSKRFRLLATAVLFCASAQATNAAVLLNSLGTRTTGGSTGSAIYIHNFSIDNLQAAVGFDVPAGTYYRLDKIELNVAARFNTAQNLTVRVCTSVNNVPGQTLSSVTLNNLPVRNDGVFMPVFPLTSIQPTQHPTLVGGNRYFIALSTPDLSNFSDIYWYVNDAGVSGTLAWLSTINSPNWGSADNIPSIPGLRVTATLVPEPFTAFSLGGFALVGLRRNR